jgi:hypothetical protein
VAFVASAAMLAMTAGPAAAAQGGRRAVAVVRGTPQRVNHSNVGATHSPRLLHELTVPGAAAGHLAATIHRSVIAGAAQGVDVASYQHPKGVAINWAQVAAAGKSFAAIKASGTLADLWSCDGSGAQQWQLIPHGGGAEVVNPQSGLCLADPGDTSAKGTAMQIITCTGSPGEGWRIQ